MATISVENFTDAGCPFAFSAEPRLLALRWRFGDQLRWTPRMIVLSEEAAQSRGPFTPERLQAGFRRLREEWGMPIDDAPRPYLPATLPAALAVVATRQYAPERADAVLRALRVEYMAGRGQLDEPGLILRAGAIGGVDPADLQAWLADPDAMIRLRADMAAARDPHPAAIAQRHKLASHGDGWRYTCPTLVFKSGTGRTAAAAGFQPTEAYEAVLANLDPTLERRADPESAAQVLEWAPYPLATAEVAEVLGVSRDEARDALGAVAEAQPAGQDVYWTLAATPAGVA